MTDDYVIEQQGEVLFVAPDANALTEWLQVWAEQVREIQHCAEQLASLYGEAEPAPWIEVITPYTPLGDWNDVRERYQRAFERLRQIWRTRTDAETRDAVAQWFRDTGRKLAHRMNPDERDRFHSEWEDALNQFIGYMHYAS